MKRSMRFVTLIGVAALGLVAVAAVLSAGATRFGEARWSHRVVATGTPSPPPATRRPTPPMLTHGHFPAWIVLAVIVAAVLCWVVIRAVLRARSLPQPAPVDLGTAPTVVAYEQVEVEVDAPAVRGGLRLALDALDEGREPGDAVVAAWLGLQSAAAESGVRRRPAETPTEFTARVITRVGADRDAAGRLVGVYQAVRFGGHPITRAEVRAARAAVEALLASWHEPVGGRRA